MKKFNEIFGRVMIEVTHTEVAMLGADIPTVSMNGSTWAEFTTWANRSFSPNLEIAYAYWGDGSHCGISAKIAGTFNEKSVSTLKANGITEWCLVADEQYDDDGRPLGMPGLYLNIPCIPDV